MQKTEEYLPLALNAHVVVDDRTSERHLVRDVVRPEAAISRYVTSALGEDFLGKSPMPESSDVELWIFWDAAFLMTEGKQSPLKTMLATQLLKSAHRELVSRGALHHPFIDPADPCEPARVRLGPYWTARGTIRQKNRLLFMQLSLAHLDRLADEGVEIDRDLTDVVAEIRGKLPHSLSACREVFERTLRNDPDLTRKYDATLRSREEYFAERSN